MSPSRMPTRLPQRASDSARLTATVVLPTPPLPAPTAITFFTPGSGGRPVSGADADRTLAVSCTCTSATPQRAHRGGGLIAHLILDRTGRRRQLDRERRAPIGNRQILHEAERDDVPSEVGIDDDAKRVEHGVAVYGGHILSILAGSW